MSKLIEERTQFHRKLCERLLAFLTTEKGRNASNADADNEASKKVGNALAEALGARDGNRVPAQTAGNLFEDLTAEFIANSIRSVAHLTPGIWNVEREKSRNPLVISRYSQYTHLAEVHELSKDNPGLAAVLGRDYSVASDVVIFRDRMTDQQINVASDFIGDDVAGADHLRKASGDAPYLHASISCKWTMRSDRAQNARTEALDLIRKRKGRVPHIVAVTAEPLPTRLSSLCLGTGDLDCVYHIALAELRGAVAALDQSEASELLELMIVGGRLKDIADLPLDLIL